MKSGKKLIVTDAENKVEELLTFEDVLIRYARLRKKYVKMWIKTYEYDDVSQVVNLALFRAYMDYDSNKSYVTFGYYAEKIIRFYMNRFHIDSAGIRKKQNRTNTKIISLDAPVNRASSDADSDLFLVDMIEDTQAVNEDDIIDHVELHTAFNKVLNDKEKKVVVLKYFYNMNQTDIAKILGVHQVMVSRILAECIRKLRLRITQEDIRKKPNLSRITPEELTEYFKKHGYTGKSKIEAAKHFGVSRSYIYTCINTFNIKEAI
jgi:RNA polymerase sigma factor (sigma-70 family)